MLPPEKSCIVTVTGVGGGGDAAAAVTLLGAAFRLPMYCCQLAQTGIQYDASLW